MLKFPLPAPRYLFQTSHLMELLQGPNSFHPDVEIHVPCAYLTFHMTDLTSNPSSRWV